MKKLETYEIAAASSEVESLNGAVERVAEVDRVGRVARSDADDSDIVLVSWYFEGLAAESSSLDELEILDGLFEMHSLNCPLELVRRRREDLHRLSQFS